MPAGFSSLSFSAGPGSGWTLLLLVGPAFIISPGLIQKSYGAANQRALRIGIGLNAAALMLFAFAPVLLGMAARALQPGISDPNSVLPYLLTRELSPWLGAIALSAVFSTEVDTSDAVLFMLSTSLSQDLYKRYLNPSASDRTMLSVARLAAIGGGALGVLMSIWLATVVEGLSIFYSLLGVTLLAPVVGGLFLRRAGQPEALASIAAGVLTWLILRFVMTGRPWLDPTLFGLVAAAGVFVIVFGVRMIGPGSHTDFRQR